MAESTGIAQGIPHSQMEETDTQALWANCACKVLHANRTQLWKTSFLDELQATRLKDQSLPTIIPKSKLEKHEIRGRVRCLKWKETLGKDKGERTQQLQVSSACFYNPLNNCTRPWSLAT